MPDFQDDDGLVDYLIAQNITALTESGEFVAILLFLDAGSEGGLRDFWGSFTDFFSRWTRWEAGLLVQDMGLPCLCPKS